VFLRSVSWFETDVAWTAAPLKMGPIGIPETSASNHLTQRKNTEDGKILELFTVLACHCECYCVIKVGAAHTHTHARTQTHTVTFYGNVKILNM
jgi:hypothetical protein